MNPENPPTGAPPPPDPTVFHSPTDAPTPPPEPEPLPEPPDRVASLAASRGLGPLEQVAKNTNPIAACLGFLVFAALVFGVAWALAWLARVTEFRIIAYVMILVVLGGLFVVGYAFFQLFDGFRAFYVFRGGLVWTHNRRIEAAGWAEVDRLVTNAVPDKDPHGGRILTLDGREAQVEFAPDSGVRDRLVEVLGEWHRPVDFTVAETPLPEEQRVNQRIAVLCGVLGVPGGLVFVFVFNVVVGLPMGFALAAGYGVIALAAAGLTFVIPKMKVPAAVFFGLVGLILVVEANKRLEANFVVVTAGVIALESAVVAVWRALWRRTPAPRRLGGRQSLARQHQWRYQNTAQIPVAGLHTMKALIGVPTGAPTTTGEGVLVATVNGVECTVYDRVRRRPLMTDPIQTGWQVPLPVALPYVTLTELALPGITLDWRGDVRIAEPKPPTRAMQILGKAVDTVPADVHPEWWIEGRYLCVAEYGVTSSTTITRHIDYLTQLAARVPWQQLADPELWQPLEPTRWDDDALFSPAVLEALRVADEERLLTLHTGEVLAVLARVDPMPGWQRLWQAAGTPEGAGLKESIDPRDYESTPRPAYRGETLLTPEFARALSAAQRIRDHYGYLVITTGVLTLGLLGFRGAGSTETLLAGGRISHAQLLSQVQTDLVGGPLPNLGAILPAAAS